MFAGVSPCFLPGVRDVCVYSTYTAVDVMERKEEK